MNRGVVRAWLAPLSCGSVLVLALAGCIAAIDPGPTGAQLYNASEESLAVVIAGSDRVATAPPKRGGSLWDRDGPIAKSDCVGTGFSIVDSSGVVRAVFDEPVCPDTIIDIGEDGTITVSGGGETLTPVPDVPSPAVTR